MDLIVPHDVFNDLIDYLDTDSRFRIDAKRYVKSDSEIVLYLSESGTNDYLIINNPNNDRVMIYLVNDMAGSIRDMIDSDKRN